MFLISVALLALVAYLIREYNSRKEFFKTRKTMGLDGPPPGIIDGNIGFFVDYVKKNGLAASPNISIDLRKKYGKTFGLYIGNTLNVLTTDPALIRELFISKFSNFTNRQHVPVNSVYPFRDGLLQVGIEGGSHSVGWKEIRSVVSAIFTSGKMKKMHRLFHDQIEAFVDCLHTKAQEKDGIMDIYGEYQALTMDVIARCAFGLNDVSCIRDRSNAFYTRARTFFANFNVEKSPLLLASFLIPALGIFRRFSTFGRAERKLVDDLSEVVAQREQDRADGKVREIPDLIDLILQENEKRVENGERPMHRDVIVSNCYAFLLAGYETTSTALSYASWLLAANPDCQQRLYDEIVETFGEDGNIDYDRVMKIPYMNAVMMETLRLKPPVAMFTARQCLHDTTLGELTIPKGTTVTTPVHSLHLDEDHWPEPRSFLPDRFLNDDRQQANSYTYMPFGIGPRNCVGARFAEMEFKTVLASVIRRFRFEVDPAEPVLQTFMSTVLQLPLNNQLSMRVLTR